MGIVRGRVVGVEVGEGEEKKFYCLDCAQRPALVQKITDENTVTEEWLRDSTPPQTAICDFCGATFPKEGEE